MQQTFPAKIGQRLSIAHITGDLKVCGWDQQVISVTSQGEIGTLQTEDDTVLIHNCEDSVELVVPYEQIITARDIDGNVSIENVRQVEIQEVSGNVSLQAIAGEVTLGNIGGNAELKGIRRLLGTSSVGGNIFVEASFPPESVTRLRASGNVHLILPSNANLTIQAMVGGIVHGQGTVSAMGNHVTLVYGDGTARLEVSAGGSLELYGDQTPKSTSTYSGNWNNVASDWKNQWQDMAHQWNVASAEFAAGFGTSFKDKFTHATEKQDQKAEKYRQKAERQARRASERAARMNIRINNREWRMDPQRIDRIVAEAYEAAARGTEGAIEAVEQALKNLRVTPPPPPRPPKPPTPPSSGPSKPPTPPHVDKDVDREVSTEPPRDWESTKTAEKSAADREQERIAILHMVADGRITPEEGDMLLEAL